MTITTAVEEEERTTASRRDWIGLGVVLTSIFMGQVDGFIVNVASPTIQRDLPAGFDQIQLVGAVFVFAAAAVLVTGGRLGDRFGHRRLFLIGGAGFTIASLLCGVAPSAELLIAFRFIQGVCAALQGPQVLAIVRNTFLDAAERGRALGAYGVALGLGVIVGIGGGGVLTDLDVAGLGWRAVFLINVPVGLVLLALTPLTIKQSRSSSPVGIDAAGVVLTAIAVPALLVPLIFGPRVGWSGWIWVVAVVGVLALVVLARQQRGLVRRGGNPLYPGRVLATRGFPLSLITVGVFFAGNAGLFLVFTYHLQTGLGLDAFAAGMMFMPLGVGFAIGSALSGRFAAKWGMRIPIVGTCVNAVCLIIGAAATSTAPGFQQVVLTIMISALGFTQGLVVAPLIGGILGRITPGDAGAASGIASTVVQFGMAFGFAVTGVWYGIVLGGTPGVPGPELADLNTAFMAAALLLAAGSVGTSVLCWRLSRLDKAES
jgi:EmrB/QacA subfamily drug resistance transporter